MDNPNPTTIAIDGPAGAGKTTVSKMLARGLGYRYLDTGALYRAVAFGVRAAGIRPDDDQGLGGVCDTMRLSVEGNRLVLYQQLQSALNQAQCHQVAHDPQFSHRLSQTHIQRSGLLVDAPLDNRLLLDRDTPLWV